jgi:uncharacterized protein (TIGR02246 family)
MFDNPPFPRYLDASQLPFFILRGEKSVTHLRLCAFGVCLLPAAMALASCSGTTSTPSQPAAVDNRAADESAIRAADAAWSKAAGEKDLARTVSYYADTAVLMVGGSPLASGKDAIQKAFADMMANPGFALSFAPTKVEVSKAGDLAYEIGDYSITFSDKKGKPQTTKAKYVVVWGKQPDGTWKVLVDSPNTTTD